MAAIDEAIQSASAASALTISKTAASALGHRFVNGGNERIYVENSSGGIVTLTVEANGTTIAGVAIPNRTQAVAAGATVAVGPFDPRIFNKTSGNDQGFCVYSLSATASVKTWVVSG